MVGQCIFEPYEVPLEEIEIDECVKNVGPVERDDTRDENQGMISKKCLTGCKLDQIRNKWKNWFG